MTTNLPATVMGMRPEIPAKINGAEVTFLVDSGASFSMITPATAARFHLALEPMPFGVFVNGSTGSAAAKLGTVQSFTLADTSIPRSQFVVTGSEMGEGAVGALGQDLLSNFDVDYDLARGSIRLLKPQGCSDKNLAYWAGDKPASILPLMNLQSRVRTQPASVVVLVNGVRLRAYLDTGAARSEMTLAAASRAGVTTKDQGVIAAGQTFGIGQHVAPVWLGPFSSFKIGDEEIKNTRILFGDMQLEEGDMLLGADFFLSHHVLVSNSQQKIYLTYNGGPVFASGVKAREVWGSASEPTPKEAVQDPTDAAGLALRGAASTSRQDYPDAIADLSRALALSPQNADYLYERGRAYLGAREPLLARADFDQALKLKPNDVPVLVLRAQLKFAARDKTGALADLDAASDAAVKEDDIRLRLAELYEGSGTLTSAIRQYDLWLATHPDASRAPAALTGRCRARALMGQELDKATADCNSALRLAPTSALGLDTRGVLRLRQNDLDGAIKDFDGALSVNPRLGRSLYGRGIAKRRRGDAAGAAADIAAALAINPSLASDFQRWNLAS